MKLPSFSKSADAYAIPPSLTAAAAALESALTEADKIKAVAQQKATDAASAEAAHIAASAALTDAEVAIALAEADGEADELIGGKHSRVGSDSDDLETAAATARAAQSTALAAISRAEMIKAALTKRAVAADAAVIEARTAYNSEMATFSNIAQHALRIELEAAAAALAPVLAKAHALASMRVMQFQHPMFESVIHSAEHGTPAILQNGKMATPSGEILDLQTEWRNFPAAASLGASVQPLYDLARRAQSHTAFTPPTAKTEAPYEVDPRNRWAVEQNRLAEEAEAAAAAAAPPPKPWQGFVRTVEYNPASGMPQPTR